MMIEELLRDNGWEAKISEKRLAEALVHWQKDIDRLRNVQDNKVNPAKYISYFSFWIRKTKPISEAYHQQHIVVDADGNSWVDFSKEYTDINERIAILLSIRQLLNYAKLGELDEVDPETHPDIISQRTCALRDFFSRSLHFLADVGSMQGSNYASIVYDMRFRTYGPHHLTTWLNQAVCASRPVRND